MSYLDRLNPAEWTSPEGKNFTFRYSEGFEKSFTHKVGEFNFSDLKGTYYQDLDVTSDKLPMKFHFAGPDSDLDANDFDAALAEKGHSTLLHPVHGSKNVQVISVKRSDNPQKKGGVVFFDVSFGETIELQPEQTTEFNVDEAGKLKDAMNFEEALQFAESIINDTQNKITEIKGTIRSKINKAKDIMAKVAFLNEEIANSFTSGVNDLLDNLDEIIEEPFNFAQQMQNVFQQPILATEARLTRLDAYVSMLSEMLQLDGNDNSAMEGKAVNDVLKNDIIISEVFAAAAMGAINYASSLSVYNNRDEAFNSVSIMKTNFDLMTDTLDTLQAKFTGELLFNQYFSQSKSFSVSNSFLFSVIADIQRRSLDLKIEKRFTLKRSIHYFTICAEYYNSIGNDILSFFESTNNITGDDYFLLKKGREIVVYI